MNIAETNPQRHWAEASVSHLTEQNIANELRSAAYRVKEYASSLKPDYIIFGGRSTLISRTICRTVGIIGTNDFIQFDPILNELFTGEKYNSSSTRAMDRLAQKHPDLSPATRLLLIDEFIDTGTKADGYKDTMHELGFDDFHIATITGNCLLREGAMHNGVFVGSYDSELYKHILQTSGSISDEMVSGRIDNIKPILRAINTVLK